jgi:hypothetical protein
VNRKILKIFLALSETLLALQAEENSAGWHFAIRKSAE